VERDLRARAAEGHDRQDLGHDGLRRQARQPHSAAAGGQARCHGRRPGRADGAGGRRSGAAGDPTAADSAGRERAARGDGRAAAGARATQGDGATAAAAEREAEHRGLQADGGHQRKDGRERGALATDLALEVRAARAAIDVAARDTAPGDATGVGGELLADLDAWGRTRVAGAHQRLARLEDERLDLLTSHPEHGSDLRMRLVAELEEHQRGALVVGEALQLVDQLAQVGAELDLRRHPLEGADVGHQPVGGDLRALRAQGREAAVASDRVEPRAQIDVARPGAQRAIGRGEAVLQGVLRLLAAAEHLSAEGEQAAVVAVVDDLERCVVPGSHACDEALVPHARQPPRTRRAWGTDVNRGGGHRGSMRH
jgi:hypothetical protein